jgi:phage gp36-like protein
MPYAVQADIERAYGEELLYTIADRDGAGAIDTGAVAQALADASAEIDTYLGSRYTVPLATVPPILKTYAVDIAVYRLARTPTEIQKDKYKDAVKFLTAVSTGSLSLGVAAPPAPASTDLPEFSSQPRVFKRCDMGGF